MLACVLLPERDPALAQRLFAVSPSVTCDGDCAFLDLRGLQRLHRHPSGVFAAIRAALAPHAPRGMALAGNRVTAELAARHGRGPVTVREGEEAAFLAHLPLAALSPGRALEQRLLPLGLRTLGDFASLPRAAVERRYGTEGLLLHQLACGQDGRALLPQREPRPLSVLAALESPVDRLALLLPALEAALTRLCTWVGEEGGGIVQLGLELTLDRGLAAGEDEAAGGTTLEAPGAEARGAEARGARRAVDGGVSGAAARDGSTVAWSLTLPEPEARAALLLDLLRGRLEAAPPGAPVTALHLQALRTEPRTGHQNSLFGEVARDAARRTEALARLAALFGEHAVAAPQLRRSHRLEQRWDLPEARTAIAPGAAPGATPDAPAHAARGATPDATPGAMSGASLHAARGEGSGAVREAKCVAAHAASRAAGAALPGGASDRTAPVPRTPCALPAAPASVSCAAGALRWLPEPEELVPVLARGALAAFRRGRLELRVARMSGPRRLSGGWWQDPWERDEYELLTDEGALYRVCRDGVRQRWLLLAELD